MANVIIFGFLFSGLGLFILAASHDLLNHHLSLGGNAMAGWALMTFAGAMSLIFGLVCIAPFFFRRAITKNSK
jgi:hypothetical protein